MYLINPNSASKPVVAPALGIIPIISPYNIPANKIAIDSII